MSLLELTNESLELATLGACITDAKFALEVIHHDVFFSQNGSSLFRAVKSSIETVGTISQEGAAIRSSPAAVYRAMNAAISVPEAREAMKELRRLSKMRHIAMACHTIGSSLTNGRMKDSPEDILADLVGKIAETQSGPADYNKLYDEIVVHPEPHRLATPWEAIDNVLDGGFPIPSVTVLGGQPSTGKTAMLIQAMCCWAEIGRYCLFFHIGAKCLSHRSKNV